VRRVGWHELYEVEPLICSRCGRDMRVIAAIHDPGVIRDILAHLKLWNPGPANRSPRVGEVPDWPVRTPLPMEYVTAPDIA
jgi:hypothetical protein